MYNYDEDKKILFMSKLPIDVSFKGYKLSDHYIAFKNYLYDVPKDDMQVCLVNDLKMLASSMATAHDKRKQSNNTPVSFEITNITESDYNSKVRNTDYAFTTIEGRLKFGFYTSPVFPILRLPDVDRFGMIRYKKQIYTILATSEPSKYVTYDGKDMLNIMLNAVNMKIRYEHNKFSITFGKDNTSKITTMLLGVCELHRMMVDGEMNLLSEDMECIENPYTMITPDAVSLIKQIVTPENVNWVYSNEHRLEDYKAHTDDPTHWTTVLNYSNIIPALFGMTDISTNGIDPYALNTIREQLNELLNIDRGLEKILSRDILSNSGEVLAKAGDLVTRDLIYILNSERINCYYVTHQDVFNQGSKIACDIAIASIPAGVLIPEKFRKDNVENLKNVPDLTDKEYFFEINEYPVIRKGTELTAVVMQLIKLANLTEKAHVRISDDKAKLTKTLLDITLDVRYYSNTAIPVLKVEEMIEFKLSNVTYVMLEEEIIGNRHFQDGEDIFFVTEEGVCVEPAPHLTVYDLVALMSIMPRMNTDYINRVADKDLGFRKHICLIDEHLHKAIKNSCEEFSNMSYKVLHDVMEGRQSSLILDEAGKLENMMWRMFNKLWHRLGGMDMTVVQLADTTNPPALSSFLNRVSTITKSKHGVSDAMRFLSMGFYGRICPYETPASSKLGLTNTKACHATIKNGELYTDYYKVVHVGGKHKVLTDNKIPMTVKQEEKFVISDITLLDLDDNDMVKNVNAMVIARVPAFDSIEKMEIQNVPIGDIDYVNCEPDQTTSPTATLIPFINSNDAVRVSYALNMARQSRPLLQRDVPMVMTKGFFDIIRATTLFQINAEENGVIEDITYKNRDALNYDTKVVVTVKYNKPVVYRHPNERVLGTEENDCIMRYSFNQVEYSYKSVIERKVEVSVGQLVKKGDVIVSSNFGKEGIYAPGKNAFVGVVPIGYNYEDGLLFADRLAKGLMSYGHTNDTFVVKRTVYPKNTRTLGYIDSNATRIIKWEDGSRRSEEYATSEKLRGYVVRVKIVEKDNRAQKQKITKNYRVDSIYLNVLDPGDKGCNRHGNKGVVPKKVKNSEMIYLLNGEHLDICYNPAGIASRMNLGQLKEMHIGLACYVLGIRVCVQSFNEMDWGESVKLLHYAWYCANYGVKKANAMNEFAMYPAAMKKDVELNELKIMHWKDAFTMDGRAMAMNPKTGKMLRRPIVVGINSVTKLIQEVEDKVHARGCLASGARYESKGGRPTHGAKRGGGQTFGPMELNGLMSYSVPNYIHELMHERGDNPYARQLYTMDMMGTSDTMIENDLNFMYENQTRRSFEKFSAKMKALGVKLEIIDPEHGIRATDTKDEDNKFLYTNSAVLGEVSPYQDRETDKADLENERRNIDAFDEIED